MFLHLPKTGYICQDWPNSKHEFWFLISLCVLEEIRWRKSGSHAEGGPLSFAFDILSPNFEFQYGNVAIFKHLPGIQDYFKQSFPEWFTWETTTIYEDRWPQSFTFDILSLNFEFQYGSVARIKYVSAIQDYFKQSFPEAFTWETITIYEDGGNLTTQQDTKLVIRSSFSIV
jgi:hypothetical protein